MKKMIALLALLCVAVMPFAVMAETATDTVTWEEVGAPMVEAAEIEGDFYTLEELGLAIFVPEGLNSVEVSEEDAAAGRLYILADEEMSCAILIDAVHVDGMTLDQAYENAVASGMIEPEIVNVNGLDTLSYENVEINAGCVVLVDTNSNMIIFSFVPFDSEEAKVVFSVIMSSLMPLE